MKPPAPWAPAVTAGGWARPLCAGRKTPPHTPLRESRLQTTGNRYTLEAFPYSRPTQCAHRAGLAQNAHGVELPTRLWCAGWNCNNVALQNQGCCFSQADGAARLSRSGSLPKACNRMSAPPNLPPAVATAAVLRPSAAPSRRRLVGGAGMRYPPGQRRGPPVQQGCKRRTKGKDPGQAYQTHTTRAVVREQHICVGPQRRRRWCKSNGVGACVWVCVCLH